MQNKSKIIKSKIIYSLFVIIFAITVVLFTYRISKLNLNSYNINIYDQIGFLIILLFIVGYYIFLILMYILLINKNISKQIIIWILITFIITFIYLVFITIPKFLGYYISDRGDSLSALGYVRSILITSQLDPLDIYPSSSILFTTLINVLDISLYDAIWIMVWIINIGFIISIVVWMRHYKLPQVGFIFAISFLLGYYHSTIIQQFFSYSLNLLILYLLFTINRNNNLAYLSVTIILLITTVFSHPFVAMFNTFTLVYLGSITKNKIYQKLFIIHALVLLTWIAYNYLLLKNLAFLSEWIKRIYIAKQIMYVETVGVPFIEVLQYFIIRFWSQIILYLILVYILVLKYIKNVTIARELIYIKEAHLFICSAIFTSILLLQKHGYDRILGLNFMIQGALPFLFYLLSRYSDILKSKTIILLIFILPFSIFSLFPSPYTGFSYTGITLNEIWGVKFTFSHMEETSQMIDPIGETKRWGIWYYGYSRVFKSSSVLYLYKTPDHFGYTQVTYFSENKYITKIEHNIFGFERYVPYEYTPQLLLVIPKYVINTYEEAPLFKYKIRYTYQDTFRLRSDPTVNVIYAGKDIAVYQPTARLL